MWSVLFTRTMNMDNNDDRFMSDESDQASQYMQACNDFADEIKNIGTKSEPEAKKQKAE